VSARCAQLAPRTGGHGRWHGPAHKGHAKCLRAARRAEARQRQFHYDARKRAAS
jgi:hypothetical protein